MLELLSDRFEKILYEKEKFGLNGLEVFMNDKYFHIEMGDIKHIIEIGNYDKDSIGRFNTRVLGIDRSMGTCIKYRLVQVGAFRKYLTDFLLNFTYESIRNYLTTSIIVLIDNNNLNLSNNDMIITIYLNTKRYINKTISKCIKIEYLDDQYVYDILSGEVYILRNDTLFYKFDLAETIIFQERIVSVLLKS